MILPSAHSDGIPFKAPQPRGRLPGIEEHDVGAGHFIRESPGVRRHAAQPLEEVQGHPFAGEHHMGGAGSASQHVAPAEPGALGRRPVPSDGRPQQAVDQVDHRSARHYTVIAGDEGPPGTPLNRHQRRGREVTCSPKVLDQGLGDDPRRLDRIGVLIRAHSGAAPCD